MSSPPPTPRRRFSAITIASIVGAIACASVIIWLMLQSLSGPPIAISRDSTYITAPLRADGLPDYEGFLLEKYREGVTPENNAGVLLYQAIWPGKLEPADYELVCDELGLTEVPSADDALQDLKGKDFRAIVTAWLEDRSGDVDHTAIDESYADDVIFAAVDAGWTADDLPPLAEWLSDNQQAIDLVVAASLRSHYYLPSPSLLNDKHEMLIEMLLPGAEGARDAVRALSIRAMNHLGEGRPEDAWKDTLALHRLACLASQAHTLVEKVVAIAMQLMANDATLAILSAKDLPVDLARRIRHDLAKLDRRVPLRDTLRTIERISTLDSAIHMSKYGFDTLSDEPIDGASDASPTKVDWNIVLNCLNYWYDRLEQAIAPAEYIERQQAIAKYESDLDASGRNVKHPFTFVKAYFSRRARSETIGAIFSNLMLPAVSAALAAEERNQTMLQLIDVAAALAVYRAEHGEYPEALAELVPKLLPQLPADPIRSRALAYQRDADGYLLYSFGPNGIDDGGSNQQQSILAGVKLDELEADARPDPLDDIPTGADDYAIRLPRPPFQLPEPPTPNPDVP